MAMFSLESSLQEAPDDLWIDSEHHEAATARRAPRASGTTWTASMLATAETATLVAEPDNEKLSAPAISSKRNIGRFFQSFRPVTAPLVTDGYGAGHWPGPPRARLCVQRTVYYAKPTTTQRVTRPRGSRLAAEAGCHGCRRGLGPQDHLGSS